MDIVLVHLQCQQIQWPVMYVATCRLYCWSTQMSLKLYVYIQYTGVYIEFNFDLVGTVLPALLSLKLLQAWQASPVYTVPALDRSNA